MKTLLVRPVSDTYIITPPIGLGYLATALRKIGEDVQILDCARERYGLEAFRSFLEKNRPDIVGFQVWSCDALNVKKSLDIVKSVNAGTVTVIGGAHPSGVGGEVLSEFKNADFAFKGEGEIGLPLLVQKIAGRSGVEFGSIPGLIWRSGDAINANAPVFIEDLDVLGFPAWDLIDPRMYPEAPHQGFMMALPIAPIFTTRGCPYSCRFCATVTITGKKVRYRSTGNIIKEIKLLRDNYGVREIHIEDDNFTINRSFVNAFCRRLLDERIDIFWYCSSGLRLDSLDEEILSLMKKANCYTLTVAIESGSQRVLDLMKKDLTIGEVEKGILLMNKVGYKPTGLFMLGFPGETKEEMRQTLEFAMRLDLKRAQFAIFHPLPGSEIYEELKSGGELKRIDWTKLKPSEAAYETPELSAKELKRFQRTAFLKFHLRPKILWYQLKEIRSFKHAVFLLRRIIDMLFS